MSKELTPLEAYNRLCSHLDYDNSDYMHNGSYEEDNEIIEKALKRLEIIDRLNKKHYEDTQNKLKALEIIKDIITIDSRDIGDNRVCIIIDGTSKIQKEEFDLLKEVLK